MYKLIITAFFGFAALVGMAQKDSTGFNWSLKNELKLNLTNAIAGLPEINYERILEDNMSIGIAASASLETPDKMIMRWQAIPHYRLYFGKRKATGFFIEGNMAIIGQRDKYSVARYTFNPDSVYYSYYDDKAISIGFGAAIGVKLITRNHFVGEIFAGGGRLFGTALTDGYARAGIMLGRRF
jgi:hypothetical protein